AEGSPQARLDDMHGDSRSTLRGARRSGDSLVRREGCRFELMIVLRNVEKYFEHGPTKSYVLRRVNAEIKEGEFVSIMGPSGAGKSTLLHLIGMHDSAWTGEYEFLELPIHRLKKRDRDDIYKKYFGFVFQSYH